jgi:hypothetical protein
METCITCIRCKNKKSPTEFGINRAIRDGRNRYCKLCCAEKRKKFRDKSGPRYLQRNVDKEVVLVVKSCEICDEKFNPISSRHRRCDTCSYVARNIVHHALVGGTKRSNKNWNNAASAVVIVEVTKRYVAAKNCCYCAQPFTDTRHKSLDHIHPVCLGGENTSDNINISCRDCNQSKAHHKLEDWVDLCKRVTQNLKP